jgi:hypothetical protein
MRPAHCKALLNEFGNGGDKSSPETPPSQLELAEESASRAEKITRRRGKLLLLLRSTGIAMSMEHSP